MLFVVKDGMPWRRPSTRVGSRYVPQQPMDDSGRSRAEHVQEDLEAHGW